MTGGMLLCCFSWLSSIPTDVLVWLHEDTPNAMMMIRLVRRLRSLRELVLDACLFESEPSTPRRLRADLSMCMQPSWVTEYMMSASPAQPCGGSVEVS
ncbi:hypothetical protein GE09DRAFT_555450 [Coniochaeta sp. 2T2.1]|nr:hypothetical protein GE09DRAFT_555450 [Coniochaeta sp. 2T2.1]